MKKNKQVHSEKTLGVFSSFLGKMYNSKNNVLVRVQVNYTNILFSIWIPKNDMFISINNEIEHFLVVRILIRKKTYKTISNQYINYTDIKDIVGVVDRSLNLCSMEVDDMYD